MNKNFSSLGGFNKQNEENGGKLRHCRKKLKRFLLELLKLQQQNCFDQRKPFPLFSSYARLSLVTKGISNRKITVERNVSFSSS